MREAIERHGTFPVAVLSGNRNFPGRIHPQIEAAFLASPPLVVAYALAGIMSGNISDDMIAQTTDGAKIFLKDLWPTGEEIDAVLAEAADPLDYNSAYETAEASKIWRSLDSPGTPLFPWNPSSTYLRHPPFASAIGTDRLGHYVAYPLLVLGDDITTDHISPAGKIPPDSEAGEWLIERGEDPHDLNVYAARRGNWEVMLRGLFANPTIRNKLDPAMLPGSTLHVPSGRVLPLWIAAEQYRTDELPVVIVAGERYGTGSSRDWAAKGVALLGVRAVLALSFERIHRSNLVGMGILPIQLPKQIQVQAGDRIEIEAAPALLTPRAPVTVTLQYTPGVRALLSPLPLLWRPA